MKVISKPGVWSVLSIFFCIFLNFTSASAASNISSPAPGSTLTSTSVTFTGGHSSQDSQHWLYVGTSVGRKQLV